MVDVRAVFKALDGKHDIVLFGADEHLRICVKNGSLVDCLQRLTEVHESLEKLLNFQLDTRLGYTTAHIENLGTFTIKASIKVDKKNKKKVRVALTKLIKNKEHVQPCAKFSFDEA